MRHNNGQWIMGLTWTDGYGGVTTNPDGSVEMAKVHSGLFYWNQFGLWRGRYLEVYAGARPTPVWGVKPDGSGYGNIGILPKLALWLRRKGWGNYGVAFRLKRSGAWKIR